MPGKSKLVRLDLEVYAELDEFRLRHESFSNATWRLLRLHEQLDKMLRSLSGEKLENTQRR